MQERVRELKDSRKEENQRRWAPRERQRLTFDRKKAHTIEL
jgi:hypothetical protein